MIFPKTPLVILVLKLKFENITFVLNHIENSAFRLPGPILTSCFSHSLWFGGRDHKLSFWGFRFLVDEVWGL